MATGVLNVVAPGSGTLVEMAGQALDAASEAVDRTARENWERELLARLGRSEAELARLGQMFEFLTGPLAVVCDKAAAFADQPDDLPDIIGQAIADDPSLAQILHQIGAVKEQFAVFQADIRRLADAGQLRQVFQPQAVSVAATVPPAPTLETKPLPNDLVEAWRVKATATPGWLGVDVYGQCMFTEKKPEGYVTVPGFKLKWTPGILKDLPVPQTAFGLTFSHMTDAGLTHLAGLTQLTSLYLQSTQVTDAGLTHLAGLTQLNSLYLNGTQVTDAGVKRIEKVLPGCEISW
jgi:hypothetical protein